MSEHASDCAVHNGPALPVGECDCRPLSEETIIEARKTRIEVLARKLCERAGYDPDALGSIMTPYYIMTPAGRVIQQPEHNHPLWTYWALVARTAIEELSSDA